jgi:hypothetical protein
MAVQTPTVAAPQAVQTVDNNPALTIAGNNSAVLAGTAKDSAGNSITSFGTPSVSTTTLSNANKITAVPAIQQQTANLSNTGSSYDVNGNVVHANGTTTPATPVQAPNPNPTPNPATTTTGGYIGDVYYPPNATVPVDSLGQPQALTQTSNTDDTILKSLNDQLVKSDAMTASIIQNIQSQYTQLISQQQQTNKGQEAAVNNNLLMGGVTGQGSSSQFAPISSAGIIQSQVSYGLSQISDLQNKENTAIIAAQQAGQNADFQLQSKINDQISKIRDEKVAAATKLNDTIAAQNQKIADNKIQQTKDTAVSNLYTNGTTDPAAILKTLTDQGLTITAAEVKDAIGNIDPEKSSIQNIAAEAAKAGASSDTVNAILKASDASTALSLATPTLSATAQASLNSKLFTPPTAKQLGGAQFYKYPSSSIVYSSKGQQLSLDQYKQLTGQTNTPDDKVDFNGIKTINPTSASTQTTPKTTTKEAITSMKSEIAQVAGSDGYMSPQDYKTALDAWQKAGYSAASFKTNFSNYINPADKQDYN